MINAIKYFPNVEVCLFIWTILIQKKEILFVISVIIKPKLVCCSKNTSKQFICLKWKEQNVKKEMKWRFSVITAVKCSWIQVSNFAVYIHTLKTRYNEPGYSEFCNIVNKTQLPFWGFTKHITFDIVNYSIQWTKRVWQNVLLYQGLSVFRFDKKLNIKKWL